MELYHELGYYGAVAIGTAAAVMLLHLWGRHPGVQHPDPPVGIPSSAPTRKTVNVEYRLADGSLVDLWHVYATLRNSEGGLFPLREGVFVGCDPDVIKPGEQVSVSVQSGLVQERLRVRTDDLTRTLFLQSNYTRAEMLCQINGTTIGGERAIISK